MLHTYVWASVCFHIIAGEEVLGKESKSDMKWSLKGAVITGFSPVHFSEKLVSGSYMKRNDAVSKDNRVMSSFLCSLFRTPSEGQYWGLVLGPQRTALLFISHLARLLLAWLIAWLDSFTM